MWEGLGILLDPFYIFLVMYIIEINESTENITTRLLVILLETLKCWVISLVLISQICNEMPIRNPIPGGVALVEPDVERAIMVIIAVIAKR